MTDTTSEAEVAEPVEGIAAADRFARLAAAAARLRGRSGPPAERWLVTAGSVLVPLGAALVLLGWYGTAHTTRVWQQIPYVVSGGLLGLGLMVVGALGYFAGWLTRLVEENRRHAREIVAAVERTAAALERLEVRLGDAPVRLEDLGAEPAVRVATGGGRNGRGPSSTGGRSRRSGGRATV